MKYHELVCLWQSDNAVFYTVESHDSIWLGQMANFVLHKKLIYTALASCTKA
jgi:hypothetical protein